MANQLSNSHSNNNKNKTNKTVKMAIERRRRIKILEGKLAGQTRKAVRSINFNWPTKRHIYVIEDEDVQMLDEDKVKEI